MNHLLIQADALRLPLPSESVDLCIGSPPYVDCRTYYEGGRDLGIARDLVEWVEWMLAVTTEALRVSRGAVIWVAAGKTEDRNYWPACEGLMWEWYKRGGHAYRPCFWNRVGIPGSGGDQWFRADTEYCMAFKRPGSLPWADNTAMGHTPKYAPGGAMSYRDSEGKRRNQWGGTEKSGGHKTTNGTTEDFVRPSHVVTTKADLKRSTTTDPRSHCIIPRPVAGMHSQESTFYVPPAVANPGNVVRAEFRDDEVGDMVAVKVGGGQLGSKLAHENEAPYPEALAEWFIRGLCPPGGTVLDPFSGSGTTVTAAVKNDRHGIGVDLRRSQCLLGARRVPASLRPVSKYDRLPRPRPAPGQQSLFDLTESP